MTKATDKLGANGEDLACSYLEEQGYTILERNLTCGRLGELDIVAGRAGFLCFIEVKTRSSELYGLPCEAVTKSKQKKLRRCAQYYLLKKGYGRKVPPISFDIVEIYKQADGTAYLRHLPHCF